MSDCLDKNPDILDKNMRVLHYISPGLIAQFCRFRLSLVGLNKIIKGERQGDQNNQWKKLRDWHGHYFCFGSG
jgi:hypothetical protein